MLKAMRGTFDIFPPDSKRWIALETILREVSGLFNYQEIRTPVFESEELFQRTVGDWTDIVSKEMYVFEDKGGRKLALRPEGTAPLARAFIEHGLSQGTLPKKYYYLGSMFRYEKPQAGRFREFRQYGAESFGSQSPFSDVEIIVLAMDIVNELGLTGTKLYLNSIGCRTCRQKYREHLVAYLKSKEQDLCDDCRVRTDKNPLRVLDCKEDSCAQAVIGAPRMLDYLCDDCRSHWEEVCRILRGTGIPFTVDTLLVRGLDYYTKTVFEVKWPPLGAQSTVLGGGRYDDLVGEIGGAKTPAVGFAMGLERILMANGKGEKPVSDEETIHCFVVSPDFSKNDLKIFEIVRDLRRAKLKVDFDPLGRSLKSQMRQADRSGAPYVVILGGDELKAGMAMVRTMTDGRQEEVPLSDLGSFLHEGVKN